ncbi:hypothetical protein SAMN05660662_1505 [Blastococcus aurantiacus]|uniref:Membrane-bound lysozyme-inhibitor of c-type lysozyme n=1 Tax=Blastococcus aurantiacus TaxID=1550231 RepID=A0A1G7JHA7_9ACTN|nr:hypothetical protein [Blastococcus aurantiacus]SDF24164.1 hypothetical protein SAMN05660662_1505 [Blastococcus aurantiacus]
MRFSPAVFLPVLALSALVGCGGKEQPDDAAATTTAEPAPESSAPGSSSATASDSPGAASPGQVPRPGPDSCEPVAEAPDGVYVVADAGEVILRLEDSGITLDVRSTDGWSTSVDSDEDEADVEFTRGDETIDFEADVEAGRLVIQVCDED